MTDRNHRLPLRLFVLAACLFAASVSASTPQPGDALAGNAAEIVRVAVRTELAAAHNDHSHWRYRDAHQDQDHSLSIVVQTEEGAVSRLIAKEGHPLSSSEASQEDAKVEAFIRDPAALARQRRNGAQDEKQARDLLNMLPAAFSWTIKSEDANGWHLHFEPDPAFNPPTLQARVLSAMAGEMFVDRTQHRIVHLSGRLTHDVTFGFGILGRLRAGGTFQVERHELKPGLWEITDTHVHMDGRALLFKNIGQQQDEVETDFTLVPPGTTLQQAADLSRP